VDTLVQTSDERRLTRESFGIVGKRNYDPKDSEWGNSSVEIQKFLLNNKKANPAKWNILVAGGKKIEKITLVVASEPVIGRNLRITAYLFWSLILYGKINLRGW